MKQLVILHSLVTDLSETFPVELAPICPICNHALSPDVLYGSLIEYDDETQNKVYLLNYCPNCDCEFISLHIWDYLSDDSYKYFLSYPTPTASQSFSDNIAALSPQFVKIYNESLQAENLGMDSICGMGYRKALEFLVKDYAISNHSDDKDKIEQQPLAQCIGNYITDERLKTLAKASAWLGNDQTHYIQKHSSHGLNELKQSINAFVTFIDADLAYQDAVSFLSGSSV